MGRIVVSDNVSLDGVIQDPAGDEGFRVGGWVGRLKDREEINALALDDAVGPKPWCWAGGATSGSRRGFHPGVAHWLTG